MFNLAPEILEETNTFGTGLACAPKDACAPSDCFVQRAREGLAATGDPTH